MEVGTVLLHGDRWLFFSFFEAIFILLVRTPEQLVRHLADSQITLSALGVAMH